MDTIDRFGIRVSRLGPLSEASVRVAIGAVLEDILEELRFANEPRRAEVQKAKDREWRRHDQAWRDIRDEWREVGGPNVPLRYTGPFIRAEIGPKELLTMTDQEVFMKTRNVGKVTLTNARRIASGL